MASLFAPKRPPQIIQAAPPAPKDPAPMPDTDSPAVMEARRRAQADILRRAGRSSTILTAPEQRGGDYTGSKLGGG